MSTHIIRTKIFLPRPARGYIGRPRLTALLNESLHRSLCVVSAPAGFGKTSLVGDWACANGFPVAWYSADESDSDPSTFLRYFISALENVAPAVCKDLFAMTSSQSPLETSMTALVNGLASVSVEFVFVLDDCHRIESLEVDRIITFIVEHIPQQMHLIIVTRQDPPLPLARLRARGQLCELRAADLRFTADETKLFFKERTVYELSTDDITALERRTEGWVAGLQLAALSMQGQCDPAQFIRTFTGGSGFVMDYLIEEVLKQQPASIQNFLMRTSILERMCAPLCDALVADPSVTGAELLAHLERANLFVIPLDNERRYYRYHHLFSELLRRRLLQSSSASAPDGGISIKDLHSRASIWFEDNGLELEALHHAALAGDTVRATRIVEGKGMPLHFRGGAAAVLCWIESLTEAELDANPKLWVISASASSISGKVNGIEEKLLRAERALHDCDENEDAGNLTGHIAAIRAFLAALRFDSAAIIAHSQRALAYLHPSNLAVRTATIWKMGIAYQMQGELAAAAHAYAEAVGISRTSGNVVIQISAASGLGSIQESENRLYAAEATYREIMTVAGDPPSLYACEAALGLGRIYYEWNDIEAACNFSKLGRQLAGVHENTERYSAYDILAARLLTVQGDYCGAAAILARSAESAHRHRYLNAIAAISAVQISVMLRQKNIAAAAVVARAVKLPLLQARVHLARRECGPALALLESERCRVEMLNRGDELLRFKILHALAYEAHGDGESAMQALEQALTLAMPGGYIRIFLDEGIMMSSLITRAFSRGVMVEYVSRIIEGFKSENSIHDSSGVLVEPLTSREREIMQLIAQGYSNQDIGEKLTLSVSTIKGHNQNIFGKLGVLRRTEAVALARQLGII